MKKRGVLIGALFSLISMGLAPISPAFADIPCFEFSGSTITEAGSCSGDVVIGPEFNTIANAAFENAFSLTSVTIPSSVTAIPNGAFANARSLRSITIPSSVTSIGEYAFQSASALESIIIPSGVSLIRKGTFLGASSLRSVTVPNSVTSIDEDAFQGASALTSISIPNTVTSIGSNAFKNTGLTSVTIPSGITAISDGLFRAAESLVSVTLPSSVTSIGDASFEGTSISSIAIPSSVTSIGGRAFASNPNLRSIVIPEGVVSLGREAFLNDLNLASVKLPDSLLILEDSLFSGATALTSVNFPKNLTRVSAKVFVNTGLASVVVPSTVTQIDEFAFAFMPNLKTAIIQSGVIGLRYGVFAFNPSLTTVVIPNSVTSIGYAFELHESDPDEDFGFRTIFEGSVNLLCATYPTVTFLGGWSYMESYGEVTPCQKSAVGTSVARGLTLATLPATEHLPTTTLKFDATTSSASITVLPLTNPAPLSATPFRVSNTTKIVDIQVSGSITGVVTLCLGGTSSDNLFHFTGGQWVELASQTYDSVNHQVCGVTTSFSPFAVAPRAALTPTYSSPDAPASVVATSTGKRSASISFTAPSSNGGSAVTLYTAISTPGGITKSLSQSSGGTFAFDNLQPGFFYTFAVTATNANGTSSAAISNAIKTTDADVASITSLTFADDGSGTAGQLFWGGKNIDSVLYTGPAGSYPTPFSFGAFTSSWNGSIRNLTPETSYTVSIYAISADGIGESKSLTFKTGMKHEVVKNLAYWNTWIPKNTYYKGEAARLLALLNKFNALETSSLRSFIKVPISLASTVSATSLTPKSCSVISTTAKVDAGLVKALTKDTCTISYTVSGPSKAPATLVKDFVFKKIS